MATDVEVKDGDYVSFGNVKTPTSSDSVNGIFYLDEVRVSAALMH